MRSDPRCPHCNEKVSATASWCMHCGQDFDEPREAGQGEFAAALDDGDTDALFESIDDSDYGPVAVGLGLAVLALLTLPIVSPPGVTLYYLLTVAGIAYLSATQSTAAKALGRGAGLLAVAPFVLWLLAAVVSVTPSVTDLLGPVVYAGVVLFVARRLGVSFSG